MPRHYIGERTVHDLGNFKEFCGSKDSRDWTLDHLLVHVDSLLVVVKIPSRPFYVFWCASRHLLRCKTDSALKLRHLPLPML